MGFSLSGISQEWPVIVSLINSMTGVSLLAMPYCFQKCGLVLSTVVLFGGALLTYSSCYSLVKSGYLTRSTSLEQLGLRCYDRVGKLTVEISIIGVLLASMVVNLVAVSDLTPLLLAVIWPNYNGLRHDASGQMAHHVLTICLALGLALPLSLRRSLDGVATISTVAVVFYWAVVAQVLVLGSAALFKEHAIVPMAWWRIEYLPECAPIFALSYSCQAQVLLLYNTLSEPSLEKMKGVLHCGIGICFVEYLLAGIFGCLAFGLQKIDGNLLTILPDTCVSTFVQFGFMTSAILSFPILVVPCRECLDSLFIQDLKTVRSSSKIEITGESEGLSLTSTSSPMPSKRLRAWTVSVVAVAVAAAVLFPNVQSALSLVGATLGCATSFLLPPLLFLKATVNAAIKFRDRLAANVVLFCGIALLLLGTGHLIVSAALPARSSDVTNAREG